MLRKDLTNQRFGRLMVIEPGENKGVSTTWICQCDCGVKKTINTNNLTTGRILSCGCWKNDKASSKGADLSGKTFGRLTALQLTSKSPRKWECICTCGAMLEATAYSLTSGNTKSCGCFQKEQASTANSSHRLSRTSLYRTWAGIKSRCLNPHNKSYYLYGGRGITLCERWHSFPNFLQDMGERGDGMTIERIDNNKGYSPDNCRWANRLEQARNRRSNVVVKLKGDTMLASEFIRTFGLNWQRTYRLLKKGVAPEDILASA